MAASNAGMIAHWYFPGRLMCEEYVTGDDVLDETNGRREDVDCQECLEWMHA